MLMIHFWDDNLGKWEDYNGYVHACFNILPNMILIYVLKLNPEFIDLILISILFQMT